MKNESTMTISFSLKRDFYILMYLNCITVRRNKKLWTKIWICCVKITIKIGLILKAYQFNNQRLKSMKVDTKFWQIDLDCWVNILFRHVSPTTEIFTFGFPILWIVEPHFQVYFHTYINKDLLPCGLKWPFSMVVIIFKAFFGKSLSLILLKSYYTTKKNLVW